LNDPPGGVLALFGHEYQFADPQMAAAVHGEAYSLYAPELLDDLSALTEFGAGWACLGKVEHPTF
jgi:hypothetical protein